jgi:pyruvate dehydrogenase E2 component (dihydrolipoamide acetyltransferase)
MYEVVMPQLSDSMDEGKLISWKVSVGDHVKSGDVIAEVESDKAVMEVQTFKEGLVKELLINEGEEAKVGAVMAKIETDVKESTPPIQEVEKPSEKKEEKSIFDDIFNINTEETKEQKPEHIEESNSVKISPKARAKAATYGLEIADIAKSATVVHAEDVETYLQEKYFTHKALKLLHAYHLKSSLFTMDHKIDEKEVQSYITQNEITLPKPLTAMQKAIISNVTASAQKPIFHIYESVDATLLTQHKEKSITVWLIKITAKVMMQHEMFRSKLLQDALGVMPNASISLAVADDKDLYMPVVTDANNLSVDAIQEKLQTFKTKLKERSFTAEDMQGSTFGISNLGMLGVERFDAMINKDDAAILAVGATIDGKIAVTLTADHRVINGYEAALFMQDLKKELQNSLNFKLKL